MAVFGLERLDDVDAWVRFIMCGSDILFGGRYDRGSEIKKAYGLYGSASLVGGYANARRKEIENGRVITMGYAGGTAPYRKEHLHSLKTAFPGWKIHVPGCLRPCCRCA